MQLSTCLSICIDRPPKQVLIIFLVSDQLILSKHIDSITNISHFLRNVWSPLDLELLKLIFVMTHIKLL